MTELPDPPNPTKGKFTIVKILAIVMGILIILAIILLVFFQGPRQVGS